ncbi:MAG: hypothetical protein K6E74_05165 [Bacilli bacterium]|nr:hypothetical protein [Bacilli bacterium]
MAINNGLANEQDIINVLDGKKYKELPEFWKNRMKQLCRDIEEDDRIECFKCVYNQKADISIRAHDRKWNISIKSGYFVSVHNERISSFVGFLRKLGISEDLITTLRLYHYGDGTIDGTGDVHKSLDEIKAEMLDKIDEFNEAVNKKEILMKIANRFICSGTPFQKSYVTHLYYGKVTYGTMIHVKTLLDYICEEFKCDTKAIHFGPFIYSPAYRGVENFDANNVKRYYINIKWPSATNDIRNAKIWYFNKKEGEDNELFIAQKE